MRGMQADETVHRDQRLGAFALLVAGPGQVELGLLRIAAERKARLEPLQGLDGRGPVAGVQFALASAYNWSAVQLAVGS